MDLLTLFIEGTTEPWKILLKRDSSSISAGAKVMDSLLAKGVVTTSSCTFLSEFAFNL